MTAYSVGDKVDVRFVGEVVETGVVITVKADRDGAHQSFETCRNNGFEITVTEKAPIVWQDGDVAEYGGDVRFLVSGAWLGKGSGAGEFGWAVNHNASEYANRMGYALILRDGKPVSA